VADATRAEHDPFAIDGPALISFSGGRTSAFMLHEILARGLRDDVHVTFANTGEEAAETLDFVHACATRWKVPIRWLEYERAYLPEYKSEAAREAAALARHASGRIANDRPRGAKERGFREVTYETANRDGGPYRNFVEMHGLPNPATRTCTAELKIRVMKKFMRELGYDRWDVVMGIRADEPKRVRLLRASPPERWEHVMPLADASITEADVLRFWQSQPFDLQLARDPEDGTYLGNCTGCMLKGTAKLVRVERERPGSLARWEAAESDTRSRFRLDRPTYAQLTHRASLPILRQTNLFDDIGDCFCHD